MIPLSPLPAGKHSDDLLKFRFTPPSRGKFRLEFHSSGQAQGNPILLMVGLPEITRNLNFDAENTDIQSEESRLNLLEEQLRRYAFASHSTRIASTECALKGWYWRSWVSKRRAKFVIAQNLNLTSRTISTQKNTWSRPKNAEQKSKLNRSLARHMRIKTAMSPSRGRARG